MVLDPALYLRFVDERLRPARDLLGQVPIETAAHIVDLGCGTGHVTALLKARFPSAMIVGVDSSDTMLEAAIQNAPGCAFVKADIAVWRPERPIDLIFSNAALHWLGGHASLFPRLLGCLVPGGVLAIQMPDMHDAPLRVVGSRIATSPPWSSHLSGVASAPPIHSPNAYWDLLAPLCAHLDIWQTTYTHVLQGHDPVLAWAAGASLRPFLTALPPALATLFKYAYADAVRPHYPARPDGATLLPFRRLFMVAKTRAGSS